MSGDGKDDPDTSFTVDGATIAIAYCLLISCLLVSGEFVR